MAFLICLSGFKRNNVLTLEVQLRCIFNAYNALGLGDLHGKRPQQCRFARACSARNNNIAARLNGLNQVVNNPRIKA